LTTGASLPRRLAAEGVGTAFLLAAVVGSGVMGERLAGGNVALALLANTLATGAALVALILTFGSISGAHLNPAVTLADASQDGIPWLHVPGYLLAQVIGAFGGVAAAHVMFGEPLFAASTHVRSGFAQAFSEGVATFGLLAVIWGCTRSRSDRVALAVGAYITAAYWFTASTSFANPAVTLARAATDTFAGIRPADVPAFLVAQLVGAAAATALFRWLVPALPRRAASVRLPHDAPASRSNPMKTVIFACVHNAGRSQMAAAFFNQMANPGIARAVSAGTQPAARVHPEVVEVMREAGIDLGAAQPQRLTRALAAEAQWLITMGCGDECPVVPGLRREDWPLRDPKGQPPEEVRKIRDEIRGRVWQLIAREGWWKLRPAPFLENAAKRKPVDHEVDQVLRWTAPDGARVVSTQPWRRGQWSVETGWEIETTGKWPAYREALDRAARAARYQPGPSSERGASFFKPETGDTYYLQVEILDHGPPLRLRVTFAARAG
jgi:glycerol uptake facilitator-like aquaporin